jgi:hypothetical protein
MLSAYPDTSFLFSPLHIATSRYLKAERFLSFDAAQRDLAEAEGLKVGPRKGEFEPRMNADLREPP